MPAVSGLEKEFPGKVTAKNVDVTEPGSRTAIQGLGFMSHGLVIRDPGGKVLWTEADHRVRMEDVRDALHKILDP